MTEPYLSLPIDDQAAASLRDSGLRLALVDTADDDAFDAWLSADARGFHSKQPSPAALAQQRELLRHRRTTGVYDDNIPVPHSPVGTVNSWPAPLTVPGPGQVDSWLISSVTVAPTHRRRGIATAMLPAELRTAVALGLPVAALTVSESTIYGRWGFGPSAFSTAWTIDARRAGWIGPATRGRLSFTTAPEFIETGRALLARQNAAHAGEVGLSEYLADRTMTPLEGAPDASTYRIVRYDGPDGDPEGFVTYTITEDDSDFTNATLDVVALVATTDAANAALWRYVIEMDLVSTVRAHTRAVDEPLPWLVRDIRRAKVTKVQDHLWTRILDVPAALEARRYENAGTLVLEVDDPLGFADGRFRVAAGSDGVASVTETTDAPDVSLPVGALASVYLGAPAAAGLAAAGRIDGDAVALDRLFRTAVPPRLSSWF
ncbi:GNAT family N-acetyltransferase [Labedella populi]|uniref:GNAT family N-acetyltransferase n=1 Tax=Labedella populi TaxID=2498850 RepID=A0A3S3ZLF7_9MICO|nr:GNAT family N-acetyltransferase [Labedella populi]RWZ59642.1 GNAT family N-acetyltransferase [Labedella populi]